MSPDSLCFHVSSSDRSVRPGEAGGLPRVAGAGRGRGADQQARHRPPLQRRASGTLAGQSHGSCEHMGRKCSDPVKIVLFLKTLRIKSDVADVLDHDRCVLDRGPASITRCRRQHGRQTGSVSSDDGRLRGTPGDCGVFTGSR